MSKALREEWDAGRLTRWEYATRVFDQAPLEEFQEWLQLCPDDIQEMIIDDVRWLADADPSTLFVVRGGAFTAAYVPPDPAPLVERAKQLLPLLP